jgi:PAS domain S-box-containing protein
MVPRYLTLLFLYVALSTDATANNIRIGVLSHRGDVATAINWSATAQHLTRTLPNHRFSIVPLDFDEIENHVVNAAIDFILVNPSIYVEMEVRHRITRIATLSRVVNDSYQNQFGGVLFTNSTRTDINSLDDIKGKLLSAVDRKSLGGFQMVMRELQDHGIDPQSDLSISFAGIHDNVVKTVLNGVADVGTVRTGILESMQQSGQIDLADVRIINARSADHFNQLHSTRLYPEWPFSKLRQTDDELAQRVAIALMQMPDHRQGEGPATSNNRWTIPLEYQPVHELLQSLRLPPYDQVTQFTFADAVRKYWVAIVSTLVFFILLAVITMLVLRLNAELKKSKSRLERQYSLILDSVADGIYGVDLDGNSTFVNKAMERITGWSAARMIGRNQHAILHHTRANGEAHPAEQCPVYKTFRDQQPRFVEDDIFWRRDGSSFPVEYSATPLRDEKNQTIGSVVIFRDISERKKAEAESRKYRSELAHMARVSTMGEMASGMAHELNQPLTAISTNADACIRLTESGAFNNETLGDILETISQQAKRAGAIIQQLRNFIRKEMPDRNPVDLNEITRDVLVMLQHNLAESAVELSLDLDDELPRVQAQNIQIAQVIVNLVINAIEAMSACVAKPKKLTIQTRSNRAQAVTFTISDSGKGIDADIQRRLFTPFATSKQSGMGLGLSISKNIIEEHGGDLLLKHSSSEGSVFEFTLPHTEETQDG